MKEYKTERNVVKINENGNYEINGEVFTEEFMVDFRRKALGLDKKFKLLRIDTKSGNTYVEKMFMNEIKTRQSSFAIFDVEDGRELKVQYDDISAIYELDPKTDEQTIKKMRGESSIQFSGE
jgi:hypothetical protein